jgi:hypothetical protein
MLTREGIKPQLKKVQAILMLNPPNNVKELRHFLEMVQYHRDMWVKCSEMLVPLIDLVGVVKQKHQKELDQEETLVVGSNSLTSVFDNVKAASQKK